MIRGIMSILCGIALLGMSSIAMTQTVQSSDQVVANWCAEACHGDVIETGKLNKKGQKHGAWVGRYKENKDLAMKGVYFNGKRTGIWSFYALKKHVDKGDGLVLDGVYKKGVKVKTWTSWREGIKSATYTYSNNGQKRTYTWLSNGELSRRGEQHRMMHKGKKRWIDHGPYLSYYKGKLHSKGQYRRNEKHGAWTYYATNSSIVEKANYRDGIYVGVRRSYFMDGTKRCETTFTGKTGTENCWYKNGNKLSKESYIASDKHLYGYAKHGTTKSWSIKGTVKKKGQYKKGESVGLWTYWFDNGKVASQGSYALQQSRWSKTPKLKGSRKGQWKLFHANGRLKTQGEYKNGVKIGTWRIWTDTGAKDKLEVYDGKNYKPKTSRWR